MIHQNDYSKLTYAELLQALQDSKSGKDVRRINKALKRYGDKAMFADRHPYLDCVIGLALGIFTAFLIMLLATK